MLFGVAAHVFQHSLQRSDMLRVKLSQSQVRNSDWLSKRFGADQYTMCILKGTDL